MLVQLSENRYILTYNKIAAYCLFSSTFVEKAFIHTYRI